MSKTHKEMEEETEITVTHRLNDRFKCTDCGTIHAYTMEYYSDSIGTYLICNECGYYNKTSIREADEPKQVGGNHYSKLKIEPVKYIMENGLDYLQGNVVKYVTRFRDKNGVEDLEKAKHYIEMLIELEQKIEE